MDMQSYIKMFGCRNGLKLRRKCFKIWIFFEKNLRFFKFIWKASFKHNFRRTYLSLLFYKLFVIVRFFINKLLPNWRLKFGLILYFYFWLIGILWPYFYSGLWSLNWALYVVEPFQFEPVFRWSVYLQSKSQGFTFITNSVE